MPMPTLQCLTTKYGNLIVVAVAGDIDLATADTMWDELCAQLMPMSALALDCAGVTFIDSMGLQALMRAHRHAAERQTSFALLGANEYVNRLLELAGLTGVIPHFADVETARAHLPRASISRAAQCVPVGEVPVEAALGDAEDLPALRRGQCRGEITVPYGWW